MTKKDLLNLIKDLPDDTEIYIAYDFAFDPDMECIDKIGVVRIEHFVSDGVISQIIIRGEGKEENTG